MPPDREQAIEAVLHLLPLVDTWNPRRDRDAAEKIVDALAALPPQPTDDRPRHGDVWEAPLVGGRFSVMVVCGHHEPPYVTGYWHGRDGTLDPDRHGSIPLPRFLSVFRLAERESDLVEGLSGSESPRAAPSDGRVREAAQVLSDALEYGLDLSDTYTLEQSDDEPISATRAPQFWRELRAKHLALRAALDAPVRESEITDEEQR